MNTSIEAPRRQRTASRGGVALLAGGFAALLASACCLGPLLLLMLGISGAWIGSLSALQAYQPFFLAASLLALVLAARRIWRPAATCIPGQVCAAPRVRRLYQGAFVVVALLVLFALGFPAVAPWFY